MNSYCVKRAAKDVCAHPTVISLRYRRCDFGCAVLSFSGRGLLHG